jgi:UDP-N-acetylmuramoylalanine--D-glutamate ligase
MTDWQGKRVTVFGLARSGQAAARLLSRLGSQVRISEQAPSEKIPAEFLTWAKGQEIPIEFGGHTPSFATGSDLFVISPGMRVDALPLQWAREWGIPVWSEIELASCFCPCPIVAVTGSNGKTTTTTLIAEILKAAGRRVWLCGNVGYPFADSVLEMTALDIVALEVSSFQLETIDSFCPHVAVWTNFSQNHLDRHRDLEEYFSAKSRIFKNQQQQDFAVLNARDERVRALVPNLRARVILFDEPGQAQEEGFKNPNYLAAVRVAQIFAVSKEVYQKVLHDFRGVEHRTERVRRLDGVDYINDSKATTVESGRWALQNTDQPVIMICGGRDKNLDYTVLRDLVRQRVKKMILIGEARPILKRVFADIVPVLEADDLERAVHLARQQAQPGDAVLLSPMCASFDMFKNYEERGRAFKEIVKRLT